VPVGLSGVIAIAAGTSHSLALKADGTVVAWGINQFGQSSVPADLSGVTAIAAGIYHSLALKSDGTVVAWGWNAYGQSSVPADLSGVTAIAAGQNHSLALKNDGTIVGWGSNVYGQISVPSGLSGVTAIAAGTYHNLALVSSAAPDLAITQVADQATVSTGDPIGFTITVTNNGDATANTVTLTDTLPIYTGVSWLVSGTDAASCAITAGVLSCNFGDMPSGAVKTIKLTSPGPTSSGKCDTPTISNTATVVAYNQPVESSATASTSVLCPYAYIEVWSDTPGVTAGDPISFNAKFGNMGEGTAKDVIAEITLPTNPGLNWSLGSIIPAEAANHCVYGTDYNGTYELICSYDQLVAGQEVNIILTSPTTSASCGMINSVGYLTLTNGIWARSIMKPPFVTCPQSVYDNFDDNTTDPSLWYIELRDSGPTASETNQRLELTLPANSAGDDFAAWYDSACQLRGDYDIQVDYELLTWPLASGARIGLTDNHANMHRVSSGTQPNDYNYPGGPDFYMTIFDTPDHVVGITPTSDLFGKLRLQRVGDTINTFYFANGSWVLDASNSDPAYTADTPFALGAWSADSVFTDQEVKVAFDNMMVNAGELVCPNTPAPDLAITQVADQETVSTGDPIGFTITVTNNGDATANTVTLSDPLPVYPEFSWSVSGTDAAACVLTGGALSCNFGDMPPGAVKTIRLIVPEYVYYSKCFSPIITSTATLMAYNQPVNKTATASVTVLCPYLFMDLYSDAYIVQPGDPVSYTLTFGNQGDGNAKDIEAFLDLQTAPGMSWEITEVTPSSAASSCTFGPDGTWMELTCILDQITPQEEVSITFASPTTSESCGMFAAAGGVMASNTVMPKMKKSYLTVNCPVVDTTPPVITPTVTGTLGANDWYTSDVSLTWSYSDPESPISSTSGCEAVSITQNQAATDYTCTATSAGGTSSGTATIKRDNTKPVTSVTNVTEGAAYALGSVPQAGCSSTDNLSGVATEATLLLTGGDAQGLGYFTAICSGALDAAGNVAVHAVVHYTVNNPSNTYNFGGFLQPVDNPGPGPTYVFNSVKAGGAVPFRFSLGGNQGLDILAEGYPTSRPISCTTAGLTDPIEQTVSAGNSGLSYDAASDTYTYVWKTNKGWSGTCRALIVQLDDGTQHLAYFQFK
jgi:uncharacterized repeat protein (TIGR01451 family)